MVLFRREIAGPIGDCDRDGATDPADVAAIIACITGPGGGSPAECLCTDTDGDRDGDLRDFCAIQRKFRP
jgi:hypothetical protein